MKKIILFFALMGAIQGANCQKVQTDAKGNYFAVKQAKDSTGSKPGKPTGKIYTDTKGVNYPVFVSERGKLFVKRISKTGNSYNQYLKVD